MIGAINNAIQSPVRMEIAAEPARARPDNNKAQDLYVVGADAQGVGSSQDIGVYTPMQIVEKAKEAYGSNFGDEQVIKDLDQRDREVRSHESRHSAALGQYARGAPHYSYQVGPDGKAYAVGGYIEADVTMNGQSGDFGKALTLRNAALVGGSVSLSDSLVASYASRVNVQA